MIGLMPIEAFMDISVLQMFGAVGRLKHDHPIHMTAKRQLSIPERSKGWYTRALDIAHKYNIRDIAIQVLYGDISKSIWKNTVTRAVNSKWYHEIIDKCMSSSSLEYLDLTKIQWGKAHFMWPVKAESRLRTAAAYRAKLITGTYILQVHNVKFKLQTNPLCPLCNTEAEDVPHFLFCCPATQKVRDTFQVRLEESDIFINTNDTDKKEMTRMLLNAGPSPKNKCISNDHKESSMINKPCKCMKLSNTVNSMVLGLHNKRNELLGIKKKPKKTKK